MEKTSIQLLDHCSVSLTSLMHRRASKARPLTAVETAGFAPVDPEVIQDSDPVSLLVETESPRELREGAQLAPDDRFQEISEGLVSARVGASGLASLVNSAYVKRVQIKKRSRLHLDRLQPDIALVDGGGSRSVPEDGDGVLIGVVDSGFDLSHPAFRDANGNLRVNGLLDQGTDTEFTTAQLAQGWANGTNPGSDENGHGTHVGSIAGGTSHSGQEGVAPGARFLLVKTDFLNTDEAVAWILDQANGTPCVVNMSLGQHFGAHDGTDAEERFHSAVTGPGRIIVASAGNEREDAIHLGSEFFPTQSEQVTFDLLPTANPAESPFVFLTAWYDPAEEFDLNLITPSGQVLPMPANGTTDRYTSNRLEIEFGHRLNNANGMVQIQVLVGTRGGFVPTQFLSGWALRVRCVTAVVGRFDAWFHNSGFARFREHPLVDISRTVGLPATGDGVLAVASHVSRNQFAGDAGTTNDIRAVLGRSSRFSSLGPARDGRWKPDISAPGQYVTAALAAGSQLSGLDERTVVADRLLTIEGTSMAAPAVAGVVALMLQRRGTLTVSQIREIFRSAARHDAHTGAGEWTPAYGYGKIDVPALLAQV